MVTTEIVRIAAYLGAGLSVGIASISAGVGEGITAGESAKALARQPKSSDSLVKSMLISQAVTETGAIFSLVVALLLLFGGSLEMLTSVGWVKAATLLGAGLAIGMGSMGPGFGSGYAGAQALKAIGRNPKHSNIITSNMLVGQALAQTDAIFALVVALLLIYSVPMPSADATVSHLVMKSIAILGAGISIGIGTFGPGAAIGFVAGKANDSLGRFPQNRGIIMRTMFLGAAVSESTALYALVISFLLIFAT